MSIAVRAPRGRQLGATTRLRFASSWQAEHIPKWICEGGATTLAPPWCSNPLGLSVFVSGPSLFLGHRSLKDMLPPRDTGQASRGSTELAEVLGPEPNPSQRRCSEFFKGLLRFWRLPRRAVAWPSWPKPL